METEVMERNRKIVHLNLIGIIANLVLSVSKLIIGSLSHSTAVVMDGINSFADLIFSSLILIFARFSAKEADEKHPFGYGRLEYLCSLIVTMLILALGLRSLYEALRNIFHPGEEPDYTFLPIAITIISLFAKLWLGNLLKKEGQSLHSKSLEAAGVDNLSDAWVAIAILLSIVIYKFSNINIENYLCVGISILIIRSGLQMLSESMTKVVGEPADPQFRKKISTMIFMQEGVYNVSSLVIHNYGEGNYIGSVDVEVDEEMKASDISSLSRKLKRQAKELGLTLTSVGISGTKVHDPKADEMWDQILLLILKHKGIVHAHSFTVDFEKKKITFTIVQDYKAQDKEEDLKKLKEEVKKLFPDMKVGISTAINI